TWIVINLDSLAAGLVDVFILDSLTYLVSGRSDSLSGSKGAILRTENGGLNWRTVASSSSFAFCWKLFIRPNGMGLASLENFSIASVFRTQDYGNTWNEVIIPSP